MPLQILVVYHRRFVWPERRTIDDHRRMFEECRLPTAVHYLNSAYGYPAWLGPARFDLLVLHPTWLAALRHPRLTPAEQRRQAEFLRRLAPRRIALPQDEHHHGRILTALLHMLGVQDVFSVAATDCWPILYPQLDPAVRLHPTRTGGLSAATRRAIEAILARGLPRDIDIGYRATAPSPRLGRHGQLKSEIALRVETAARARGLRTDISLDARESFGGLAWYQFLARCRYTIGVEGGSSLLDPDGTLSLRVRRYLHRHPGASFAQVEAACFSGHDGNVDYRALSPRQLEAAATGTAQILIQGEYGGLLRPETHYLPLAADFSNLDAVLDRLADDSIRQNLAARCRQELITSGLADSGRLADAILSSLSHPRSAPDDPAQQGICRRLAIRERCLAWWRPRETRLARILRPLLGI